MEIQKANFVFENENEQIALQKLLQQLSVSPEDIGATESVRSQNESSDSDSR